MALAENRCRQSAYTIVEVLVAVLILGILTFSLFGAFSSGMAVVQSSRENLRATEILVQKLEALRLLTWSQMTNANLAPGSFSDWYDPSGASNGTAGVLYQGSVSNSPADVPAVYANDMRLVTITVVWTNYAQGSAGPVLRSRQVQTLVARNGMQNHLP